MSADTEPAAAEEPIEIETLGRELGEAITALPEYQEFAEAQEAVKADPEAQELIQSFEQQRQAFMVKRATGEASKEDLEGVQAAQQELNGLPVMERFLAAQETLAARFEDINGAISEPLSIDFGDQVGGCCQD